MVVMCEFSLIVPNEVIGARSWTPFDPPSSWLNILDEV